VSADASAPQPARSSSKRLALRRRARVRTGVALLVGGGLAGTG
jgi:hypothetical protein